MLALKTSSSKLKMQPNDETHGLGITDMIVSQKKKTFFFFFCPTILG